MMNELRSPDRVQVHMVRLLHALRPDWDEPGIAVALARAVDKGNLADAAAAAIRLAADTSIRTPAVIPMPGRHWAATTAPESNYRHPPNLAETLATGCRQHLEPNPCRSCAAERKSAGAPLPPMPRDSRVAVAGVAAVRAAFAGRPRGRTAVSGPDTTEGQDQTADEGEEVAG